VLRSSWCRPRSKPEHGDPGSERHYRSQEGCHSRRRYQGGDAAVKRLQAIKKRHETAVADACAAYGRLQSEKADLEGQRAAAPTRLEEHSDKVVKPYERRINALLEDFNAGFSIAETSYAYSRRRGHLLVSACNHDTAVDIGDGKTMDAVS
jgi:hypothetical protein